MGGNFLLKLNIDPRPIANKYREGKVKRTLKRELKVPEIAKKEANETSFLSQDCFTISGSALWSLRGSGVVEGDLWSVSCG